LHKRFAALLLLFVLGCFFVSPGFTKASGSVVLTSGAFSDSDAEDTHNASQWIVRDSSSTVFDSGTDTTNLTSITIAESYFSGGETYYWKVRFRDQHLIWGAYSDETSFVYPSSATPTPTTTSTSTPAPGVSTTTTTTATTTTTVTTTVSAGNTETVTATSTITSTATITTTTTITAKVSTTPGGPFGSQTAVVPGGSLTPGPGFTFTPTTRGKYPGQCQDCVAGVDPTIPKIVLASASAIAASMEGFSGLMFGSRFVSSLISLFSRLLRLVPWRRRKKKWGYVYDSISKYPIVGAQVRIYSEPDSRLRQTQFTLNDGSFGFVVPGGKYSLVAGKEFYAFPSTIVHGRTDGLYENLYFGEEVAINVPSESNKTGEFKLSIPLDQTKIAGAELVGADMIMRVKRFFDLVRMPILIAGTILTVYLVLRFNQIIDWLLLVLYVYVWAYEIYSRITPRTYGRVIDQLGKGVPAAIIRIIGSSGKIIATTVAGEDGHFRASLTKGVFIFDATKLGYTRSRTGLMVFKKPGDLSKVDIKISKISRTGNFNS